jgi:hypothetical protein
VNPGWLAALDDRNGIGIDTTSDTYFMTDYEGDVTNRNDNIIEVDVDGIILNAWETDGPSNDTYNGTSIDEILDIAVVPGTPTRYFATAFNDGNKVYELDLIQNGLWADDSWGKIGECTVPGLTDNYGIDYDEANGVLYHVGDSNTVVVTDLECNLVTSFTCSGAANYNSGVTFIEGVWPAEVWVTDPTSNTTTRCEATGEQPDWEVVQAMSQVGMGDVFAIGDANLWDNYDHDSNGTVSLFEFDNEQLAFNVFALGEECTYCRNIALFKDNYNPLGIDPDPNEEIMTARKIAYETYGSADMGTIDLSPYCKVIVASDQPLSFYQALSSNRSWFEGWIDTGGIFEFHGATYSVDDDWQGLTMPGGFSHVRSLVDDVTISDSTHDLLNQPNTITGTELDGWNYSTHGYFVSLPMNANPIVLHGANVQPTTSEFTLGKGCVVATDQTLEYGWDLGYSAILENFILYSECSGFSRVYLPLFFAVYP